MDSPEKVDSMGYFLDPLAWDIWGIVLARPVEMEDPPIVGSTFLWEQGSNSWLFGSRKSELGTTGICTWIHCPKLLIIGLMGWLL